MKKNLQIRNKNIELGHKTLIMGVLNCTPDSFSDGGNFNKLSTAVEHCLEMIKDGADIIDIGGESTRPGSDQVSISEELRRVIPVIEELKLKKPNCIISIDTQKPEVAEKAVNCGADIINDVSGLQYSKETANIAAQYNVAVVLMHMKGTPKTMQKEIQYDNFLNDVNSFLCDAADTALKAGVKKNQIIIDPGIGFGKTLEHNISILSNVAFFKKAGYPVLVGPSRKAFIGTLLNESNPQKRVWGTAGAIAALAAQKTDIVRVHDVKEIAQLLKIFEAVKPEIKYCP
jgi:dihydropteroate synthase